MSASTSWTGSQLLCEEIQDLLEHFATLHSEFYIFYDFNLQLDKRTPVNVTFDDIITSCDLKQHVTFSTHIYDLAITRSTCDNIQMLTVSDGLLDHHTAATLPRHVSIKYLRDSFSNHLKKKISLIRSAFPDQVLYKRIIHK